MLDMSSGYNHLISNKCEWNNFLSKTPPQYRKLKQKKNLLVLTHHIFMAWYNTMITKPLKTLELHYPMIQFLKLYCNIYNSSNQRLWECLDIFNSLNLISWMKGQSTIEVRILGKIFKNASSWSKALAWSSWCHYLCQLDITWLHTERL